MKPIYFVCLFALLAGLIACESQADHINRLILQLGDSNTAVQTRAYKELTAMDGSAVAPLIKALGSNQNPAIRRSAVRALMEIGDASAIDPLAAALGDADPAVRQEAASGLTGFGAAAVPHLTTALQGTNTQIRTASAVTLGKIGDATAVQPLIDALGDSDGLLRQAAANALGQLKDPRAVTPLIAALKDHDGPVRAVAIDALVNIGAASVDPLLAAMSDSYSYVITQDGAQLEIRQEAALALGRIGDTRTILPLINALGNADLPFSRDAASALAAIGAPAVDPLIASLSSDNSQVVRFSARALGQIKDMRAVQPLIAIIQNEDTVRGQAAYAGIAAMGNVAQPLTQPFLLDALQAHNLKVLADCYDFYIMQGDPVAIPDLIAAMNFYADAYGNYDDNGMVALAERYLNCGNDDLHAAAIGWGESHNFQVEVTPCPEVAAVWGQGTYDDYCGAGKVTWGNAPFTPQSIYVLFRYADAESTIISPGGHPAGTSPHFR